MSINEKVLLIVSRMLDKKTAFEYAFVKYASEESIRNHLIRLESRASNSFRFNLVDLTVPLVHEHSYQKSMKLNTLTLEELNKYSKSLHREKLSDSVFYMIKPEGLNGLIFDELRSELDQDLITTAQQILRKMDLIKLVNVLESEEVRNKALEQFTIAAKSFEFEMKHIEILMNEIIELEKEFIYA